MDKFGLFLICALCICVTHCRPESLQQQQQQSPMMPTQPTSSSASVRSSVNNDQMVFPDSGENRSAAVQVKRTLSPTPAGGAPCRPIVVFRVPNGTLTHRYTNCDSDYNAAPTVANRINDGNTLVVAMYSKGSEPDNTTVPIAVLPTPISGGTQNRPRPTVSNTVTVYITSKGSRDMSISDNIVFPDNDSTEFQTAVEPECANGQRFCTEDASYPKSQIDMLLQRVDHLDDLLHSDVPDDTELTQRVDVPGEETFCDYDTKMEYPTKALSRDEKWLPIVNHANYTQGIRMEMCRNSERPCKMADVFPSIIKTRCVQKYQFRQLLALHEDGQLRRDFFSIPTCCVCTFSKM